MPRRKRRADLPALVPGQVPAEFDEQQAEAVRRAALVAIGERIEEICNAVVSQALEGNVAAARLCFEVLGLVRRGFNLAVVNDLRGVGVPLSREEERQLSSDMWDRLDDEERKDLVRRGVFSPAEAERLDRGERLERDGGGGEYWKMRR